MLVSLWKRLLNDLGLRRASGRVYQFDEMLTHSLQELAEREQRSEEDLARDLLHLALAQRRIAEVYLQLWQSLSPREQQVAALACLNYTNQQIAERLMISQHTVKSHIRKVLYKLNLNSKSELRRTFADWDFSAWQNQP